MTLNWSTAITQLRGSPYLVLLLPIGIWGLFWLGIPGEYINIGRLWQPSGLRDVVTGISALLPFMAAAMSLGFVVLRFAKGNRPGFQLSSPLIFITVYATLGLFASFQSPKGIESIYGRRSI